MRLQSMQLNCRTQICSRTADPYTQNVINATLPIMQQNLGLQQNQQQNAANSANAFGGSRQGIQQGVTQAQGAQNMAQMAQQLNQANFAQAQQAGLSDVSAQNQVGLANQQNQRANLGRQNTDLLANQRRQRRRFTASTRCADIQSKRRPAAGRARQSSLGRSGHARQSADAEQCRQFRHVDLSKRFRAAGAGARTRSMRNWPSSVRPSSYPQQQLGVMESSLGMTPYGT